MRYFYDTEFVEDGHTIDLISIGIVADDGREYYAHLDGYDMDKALAHEFVGVNVLPYVQDMPRTPRDQVAREIAQFMAPTTLPRLWGHFPAYDHVALAQLYGTMVDLPYHLPQYTNCIRQLADSRGKKALLPNDQAHDALADARWTKLNYDWITRGLQTR